MATEFKLPDLGEDVESADVAQIYVSEGDELEADQNVMELETEKAVADLPCPHGGKISQIHVGQGDTIRVGQTLLTIEEAETQDNPPDPSDEAPSDTEAEPPTDQESTSEGPEVTDEHEQQDDDQQDDQQNAAAKSDRNDQSVEADESDADEQVAVRSRNEASANDQDNRQDRLPPPAGPATRRLARRLGVALENLEPPDGDRIRQEDVVRLYLESGKAALLTSESLPDFEKFGTVQREPLNKIAQTSARRLTASWRSIPHVTQHGLADITELEAARKKYLESKDDSAPRLTLTAITIKAVVGLLKQFPKFNSTLDAEQSELILKLHYHIGVAVDTDHGLLVPTIRDADGKSIERIAEELTRISDRARRRELRKADLEGGTFTVSNQGGIGGGEFTPIVNYPEVAILGMARARPEVRITSGQPTERLMLPLCLSYDHRVINGAEAARFVQRLCDILSDEFALLVAV